MSCTRSTTERLGLSPPHTVGQVDFARFAGTWYDAASFPQDFQQDCYATTATYRLLPTAELEVFNRCRKGSLRGPEDTIRGRARVADPEKPARLEVSFFHFLWAPYWILELGAEYDYAVVGHPGRDFLWILSRTPRMAPEVYRGIVNRLRQQQFPVERLRLTPQPAAGGEAGG